jgi:hypothetical protein
MQWAAPGDREQGRAGSLHPGAKQDPSACERVRCRIVPYRIKAAPLRSAAGPAPRRALPWKARPAHAGPRIAGTADKEGSTDNRRVQ